MAIRCGCYREGDATVFGDPHECGKEPDTPKPTKAQTSFGPFIPSWRFVVPETSEGVAADNLQQELDRLERDDPAVATASAGLDAVYEHLKGRLPSPLVAEIYDLERPYERVLGEDELHD